MTPAFFRNDLVLDTDGACHRILHIEQAQIQSSPPHSMGVVWLIDIDYAKALPRKISLESLLSGYTLRPVVNPISPRESTDVFQPTMKALAKPIRKTDLDVANRASERIAPLVNNPAILAPTTRHALLIERSLQPGGATYKTLLKDLRRWWQGGQTLDALSGKYHACGLNEVKASRGRSRKAKGDLKTAAQAALRPFKLSDQDCQNMREALETYYLVEGSKYTLSATLQKMHEDRYKYVDGNGQLCLLHKRECPSRRQLDYFVKSNYPLSTRLLRRKGEKRFAQEDRSTEGSIQLECHGAGHLYEIDATIVDVVLVSAKDRKKIVGKPTLYLIIDRHSRLIVGWYLGFENACYTAAMQALLSIGEDKQALCKRLGIPYDTADWPAHAAMPEQFLADQGELISKEARRIGRSLRSTISNVPGLRPDWKPLVECGFKLIHQIIAPETPGYTPDAEARRRRAIKVDKEACLDIHELQIILVAAIIAQNKTMQVDYPLTTAQVADGVPPIPRELFLHSMHRRMGSFDRMNFDKVREELLPRGNAVITGDGIKFKKLLFSCPEAKDQGWLVQGRKQRRPVEVAFDYRLVDEIVLYSPNGNGQSFVAQLTKDSQQFKGMAFKEVHQHFAAVEDLTADAVEVRRQNKFEFHQLTQPVIDDAVRETKAATKGVSRSSRRKDVAPARNGELKDERAASGGVFTSPIPPSPATAATPTIDQASNVVRIDRTLPTQAPTGLPQPPTAPAEAAHLEKPKTLAQRVAEYRTSL